MGWLGRFGDIIQNIPANVNAEFHRWIGEHDTAEQIQQDANRFDQESAARHNPITNEQRAILDAPYNPPTSIPNYSPPNPTPSQQEIFTSDYLAYGSTGADVSRLQTFLGMRATGVYDRATENNVEYYQSRRGLDADGIAGPQTLGQMEREIRQKMGLQASIDSQISNTSGVSFETASADMTDVTVPNVPNINTSTQAMTV